MAAGQEVISYCGSCKHALAHIIVAHKSGNEGAIAKVTCKTCNKTHGYRDPDKSGSSGKAKTTRTRAAVKVVSTQEEWKTQMEQIGDKPTLDYSIKQQFVVGDVIKHPSFGLGIVQELKDQHKIQTLFQNDMKVLIHNR